MYDEMWVGGKVMYKLEPVVADGGTLIVYGPHIHEISRTWGGYLERVGYHVADYFQTRMQQFRDVPRGVLAHSALVKGEGSYRDGVERPRIDVVLATGLSAEVCERINLGYLDPATLDPRDHYRNREQEGSPLRGPCRRDVAPGRRLRAAPAARPAAASCSSTSTAWCAIRSGSASSAAGSRTASCVGPASSRSGSRCSRGDGSAICAR